MNQARETRILERISSNFAKVVPGDILQFAVGQAGPRDPQFTVEYIINADGTLYYPKKQEHLPGADRDWYTGISFRWNFNIVVSNPQGANFQFSFNSKPAELFEVGYQRTTAVDTGFSPVQVYGAMADSAFDDFGSKLLSELSVNEGGSRSDTKEGPETASAARTLSAEEVFRKVSPSVFVVKTLDPDDAPGKQGSAVMIGPGLLVTNYHVVENAVGISVLRGSETWPVQHLTCDGDHDLAILKVEGLESPAVVARLSSSLAVGERVYAIGSPEGLELTFSEGVVSAFRESDGVRLIQTSAPISPGSSGGGLFDAAGYLVGITTFQLGEGQSLNFALPGEWATDLLKDSQSANDEACNPKAKAQPPQRSNWQRSKVLAILREADTDDATRQAAWEAFYQTTGPDDFKSRLDKINLPRSVKHDMWDLKFGAEVPKSSAAHSDLDTIDSVSSVDGISGVLDTVAGHTFSLIGSPERDIVAQWQRGEGIEIQGNCDSGGPPCVIVNVHRNGETAHAHFLR